MEAKIQVEQSEELTAQLIEKSLTAQKNLDEEQVNVYECESCGLKENLTEEQAYMAGWDYPPFIGLWGVVSPRTCPGCLIDTTAYWFLLNRGAADQEPIPEKHMTTLKRIVAEEGPTRATS